MKTKPQKISLAQAVAFCDTLTSRKKIADFEGAVNGLQCANRSGAVTHIGAAVDAGLAAFERAAFAGVDFLIVHHGLFWTNPVPLTGVNFKRVDALMAQNIALYGSHLPLDAHKDFGNSATIARLLSLKISKWELPYEGTPLVPTVTSCPARTALRSKLEKLFPRTLAIEKGPARPKKIAVVSGSGAGVMPHLKEIGVDTLVTGELRQAHYAQAEDEGLNLYCCGHYATEVFGVQALAQRLGKKFDLPWTWIGSDCPL